MKQVKKSNKKGNEKKFFFMTIEKKKKILAIGLILFSSLVFLSILSYSSYDAANLDNPFFDFFKVFSSNPDFLQRAENTNNWLGIFGAYVSYFFVNSTIGYFSIVFPVVLFLWGYSIVNKMETRLAVYLSNFFIIEGVLLASFFGLLNFSYGILEGSHELYGNIGEFFGAVTGRLLGGLGGIILIFALILVSLIIVFDIKITQLFENLKKFVSSSFEEETSKSEIKINTKEENLSKIEKLGKRKKRREKLPVETDQIAKEADEENTKIRIIRQETETGDQEDAPQNKTEVETSAESETEEKKEEKDNGEKIDPTILKAQEEELPNQWEEELDYSFPGSDLLVYADDEDKKISELELKKNAELLKDKLALFDIDIEDISVTPGPVVTLYEIVPSPGVKISRIVSLQDDIALALAARGIRIIAPIPGKSVIGVEIPNSESAIVRARSVISKLKESKAELPLAIGKTIVGEVYIADLATMPHLLIAGSTGSGKSVGINMIITSLLYSKHPSEIKFAMVDPKKIELSFYKKLSKHYLATTPDLDEEIITSPQNALLLLKSIEIEMEKRYDKLAKLGVRNIVDYNKKVADPRKLPGETHGIVHYKLPYIIIIIDELADLMITSGKEVEGPITRLAQLARAVGIHLIVATQRPSVNVITGVIKANFSARIAYHVASKTDSRTILDMNGAEQLLGRGDMLFLPGGMPKPIRMQNAFVSTEEVERVTNYVYVQKGYSKRFLLPSIFEKKSVSGSNNIADLDEMFADAASLVVEHQQGSVSLLQRRLKLGYARAARIVDQLEEAGIVGQAEGSKAREVLVESKEELETILRSL
jgi:S-DNA-T family DNA segregation ATPase FtsK/SpoIIIE